ncbi:MAG: type II toxin-antitoxin system VapC family toxin [Thiomargarita sp.]|nr:type II toxin-antitoxin system VapC family toxin [Thiomargarita sp.]
MKKYLLDTNICIFYLKGRFQLADKIEAVYLSNCFISEITIAELKFCAENSDKIEQNRLVVHELQNKIQIVPIIGALDLYAKEKARLRRAGTPLDDFDLLIGTTAIANGLIMVTHDTNHFKRLQGIKLEDWTKAR